jgi:phospholipid/cholesterol/gamma-HCH transport system substrate-binding protein
MSRFRVSVAVLLAIGLAGGATGAVLRHRERAPVHVVAVFADASPLRSGNEVKMYGVRVGLIDRVTLVGRRAHVSMDLDPSVGVLHSDATATIRPVSLLGERYLALDPGGAQAPPLGEPAVIPLARTARAVDLDELLDTVDDPTSVALAALVTTFGEGLDGHGAQLARALDALAPALVRTDRLTAILDAQNATLNALVDESSATAQALGDRNGTTLDTLVGTTRRTLGTVSAQRDAVDRALGQLPGTLDSVRRALRALRGTAEATTPVLRSVRPLTDHLGAVSRELVGFSDAADPALTSLRPLLRRAGELAERARPVAADLRPASADLADAANSLRLIAQPLVQHGPGVPSHMENLMTGIADWAMATSGYDGLSHYFRGVAVVTPRTLGNVARGLLTPPTVSSPPAPGGAGPGVAPLGGSRPAEASGPGGVTGLTPGQEHGLLGELVGEGS